MRQSVSGRTALLPLGYRVFQKAAQFARDELDKAGWSEVLLEDEKPLTHAISSDLRSYKQLPLLLYQLSSQFESARLGTLSGFSFHASPREQIAMTEQVVTIFQRMTDLSGLRPITARVPDGYAILLPSPYGADELIVSDRGNYSATRDGAEIGHRSWDLAGEPIADLDKVHTPAMPTIEALCQFLNVPSRQVLKTLVYQATSPIPLNYVVAVVRGDHQINQYKLAKVAEAMGAKHLELADSQKVRETFALGFVGPDAGIKVPDAVLIIDADAAQGSRTWIAGANEVDFHVRNFNWFRECGDRLADPTKTLVADIRSVVSGDPSPLNDGGTLGVQAAIELARVARRDDGFGATFDDESGRRQSIVASTFTLDLFGLICAVVESHHDDRGIRWPAALAPCAVVITPIKYAGSVKEAADRLCTQLGFEEVDTILDDRDARPGFKFADADLIGFPLRINVGEKHLGQGTVELKLRSGSDAQLIPINEVVPRVRAALVDFGV